MPCRPKSGKIAPSHPAPRHKPPQPQNAPTSPRSSREHPAPSQTPHPTLLPQCPNQPTKPHGSRLQTPWPNRPSSPPTYIAVVRRSGGCPSPLQSPLQEDAVDALGAADGGGRRSRWERARWWVELLSNSVEGEGRGWRGEGEIGGGHFEAGGFAVLAYGRVESIIVEWIGWLIGPGSVRSRPLV